MCELAVHFYYFFILFWSEAPLGIFPDIDRGVTHCPKVFAADQNQDLNILALKL
jgi:hypothetical protein